ncbi:hypothetical protein BRADI_1g47937v3 [Brachypodium distachyon]|uniref:Uncharacterized protein n=1 Tax=Brachypodium distachyon TaxID=15368 RepID=A0A2K2DQ55_BRADI|nr:hypothetical protein BRADI_1g47937v3 [Brachypodium distachyon]
MDLLLALGCLTGFLALLAPTFPFFLFGSTFHSASPYAYVFTFVSSGLWLIYNSLDGGVPYLLSFGGVLLGIFYVFLFLYLSDAHDRRRTYLLFYVLGGTLFFFASVFVYIFTSESIYGHLCSAVSIVTALFPFWNMWTVIQTRSMATMPAPIIPALSH